MKYIGEFDSITKKQYKIEIVTAKSGADTKIKLSGDPFVSSIYNADEGHIYTPIRCGGATVGVLTDYYIPDFYSGKPKGVSVKLTNTTDNKVEWVGYVTPTIYTQGYDKPFEEIQLDCVDGIALLKDIKYLVNGEKQVKKFSQIIAYCLNQAGCFKNLYITDNVQMKSATANDSVIEIFRVSETGLFDKKDDINEPDENVAWSCYDVLYQICQFLGYTLITEGEDVIILDFDAIKNGNNKYFKYTLGGNDLTSPTSATLNFNYHIQDNSYAQNGTSLEMTEVFNKVTVVDEFNSLTSDELDTKKSLNITSHNDPYWKESWIEGKGIGNWYDVCDTIVEQDEDGNDITYQITVHRMHSQRWYYTIVKYYDDPRFKFYRYSKNAPYTPQTRTEDGAGLMMNSRGGSLCKFCHIELGDDSIWHSSPLYTSRDNLDRMTMNQRRNEWVRLLNNKLANLNYTDCIVLMNGDQGKDGHIGYTNAKDTFEYKQANIGNGAEWVGASSYKEKFLDYPCVEYTAENPAIFGQRDSYIKISGNITTHDEWWNPWPMNNGVDNESLKYKKKQKCVYGMFLWAKLQWGDLYYAGRMGSNTWRTTESYFKLFYYDGIEGNMGGRGDDKDGGRIWNEHYTKKWFDRNLPLIENRGADFVVGEDGYFIPAPDESYGTLSGNIKLTLYMPRDVWDLNDNRCDRYYTCVQCLTDFKIEGKINTGGSLGDDSALESDTVYTNVIDNGSVNEMEEISFKICTFDNKNTSYSVVEYLKDDGKTAFVDQTYNKANHSKEGTTMRQEEHLIFKLVSQYEEPKLKFNCNLKLDLAPRLYGTFTDKTITGKTFMVEGVEKDYKMSKATLNLIEKW